MAPFIFSIAPQSMLKGFIMLPLEQAQAQMLEQLPLPTHTETLS